MPLKTNLVALMKDKNISIQALANKTGISEPTLKRLRTQHNANPTLDVLMRIATALNVSVNDLIQARTQRSIFQQGDSLTLEDATTEFVIVFTRKIFAFKPGSKAIFKKYTAGESITKYIITQKGQLLEKISGETWLFRDADYKNYSIHDGIISAMIIKELYEVTYV